MIKRNIIIPAILFLLMLPVRAQVNEQTGGVKREVTLYNPYKPSLHVAKKRSYLPDMNDTMKVRPDFRYEVSSEPFLPSYTISPIKPASLLPDPLPKLYKSFVNIGLGNYLTPLAEISITNERSKKGTIGFYGRHFSSNGDVQLENGRNAFAGLMDNDASLFGRKFFRKSLFESSVDFSQRVRYAYGYKPELVGYDPEKEDIRMRYNNIGANASMKSITIDSLDFSYDFGIFYNYFYHVENMYQNNFGLKGEMAKTYKEFYIGSGIDFEYYKNADSISAGSDFFFSLSPFLKKGTQQWNLKLGFQALIDRSNNLHLYPDINFGFSVVPSYISFFAGLNGKLEKNEPLKIIAENPFLANNQYPDFIPDGILFRLPDTDHELIISGGLKGNTGLGGNYLVSASYSLINDMLFYSNLLLSDPINPALGNYFLPIADDVELFNVHAEMTGSFTEKISFAWMANINNYNTGQEYAWNKPGWDGKIGLKYNLRDKIIGGMELSAIGKRRVVVSRDYLSMQAGYIPEITDMATHFNMSLTGEYRYSKILSFWTKFQNISTNRYYEWAYYPSQRFLMMFGFTYSL